MRVCGVRLVAVIRDRLRSDFTPSVARFEIVQTDCDNCALASWLIFPKSSLFLLGLMALASSSSKTSSSRSNSIFVASRLTMMVPLFFLVLIFGLGSSSEGAESAECPLLWTEELLLGLEVGECSGDWAEEKGGVVMLRGVMCSRRLSGEREKD